jgi:hypothetical protein
MATRMFIKGRLITKATISGGTRASTGVITYPADPTTPVAGSVYSLTGKLAGVSFTAATVRATINSIDDLVVHEEILMDGATCQIQEIMTMKDDTGTGLGVIALQAIYSSFDFALVYLLVGSGTNKREYVFRGTRGDLGTGVSSAGENIATLTLQSINDATYGSSLKFDTLA